MFLYTAAAFSYILREGKFPGQSEKTCGMCFCLTERLPSTLAVYPLDDKRKRNDISREKNPPAKLGKVTYGEGPDGRQYGSTQFSGLSNSYVEIPNTGKLDARYSITVLTHVFKEKRSGGYILRYNPAGKGFQVRIISGRLEVQIVERRRRTTFLVSTRKPVIGEKVWRYIGVTYSERTQRLTIWVNSNPISFKVLRKVQLDTKYPIRLGGSVNGQYFRGRLFCLQLYSVALSQGEIEEARKKCFLKGNSYAKSFALCFLRCLSNIHACYNVKVFLTISL